MRGINGEAKAAPPVFARSFVIAFFSAYCCLIEALPAFADEPAPATQTLQIRPSLSLEVNASDNIRRTAIDPQSDIVFVPEAGLLVTSDGSRLDLFASAHLRYDYFLNQTLSDRMTGDLLTHGTLTVAPGLFFIDGSAQINDEFLKLSDQSPTGLPNGNAQSRVINAQISPYMTTSILGEADATLRGRVSEVQFTALESSTAATPPSNATTYGGNGQLTNGSRSRLVQWNLTGEYTFQHRDDGRDFTSTDGLFGVTVRLTPMLHVLGRIGYELVEDPSIPDIRDAIWAGGFTYQMGESSSVTAERRHRFGEDAWYANLDLALTSMLSMSGGYEERFENEQLRLSRSLNDVFDQSGGPPPPPTPVSLNEDLVNESFFVRDARIAAIYHSSLRQFEISADLSQRDFTTLNDHDESAGVSARYTETLPANLRLNLSGTYTSILEPRIGQAKASTYTAMGGFTYRLSESVDASLSYTWSRTDSFETISENLISASISKAF